MPLTTIYLDNNATTRVADEVIAAMTPYHRDFYGNAHAVHALGRRAHDAVEEARRSVAKLTGCDAAEVVFTSCGTEGNALAIRGLVDTKPQRRRVVATAVEHPSVMTLLRAIEAAGEIELAVAPVGPDGELDLDAMGDLVDDRTLLVSVMLAQNETGVILPVSDVAKIAHDRGALLHVDAVQAATKIPIDARALGADFLTISGHKFHAPKGVAALMVRRGLKLTPLWFGGGQELGLRSGTEPVPSLAGLGVAADLGRRALADYGRVTALRDRLETFLRDASSDISINGASQPRLGNTANVSFHGLMADSVVRALDEAGVCVSAGAACHSGRVEPTAVMKAMNKPARAALGAVRFSLSRYTTEAEIDRAAGAVLDAVSGKARISI